MKCAASLLAVTVGFSLHAAESPDLLKLVQTIPLPGVKGRFDHFSMDPKGHRLFVAALGNNTLEVIDVAAGKRTQGVAGMSKPCGVLYLEEQGQIAVANGDDGTFKLLDAATFKLAHSLADLPDADNLRSDPKTKLAWLGYGDGALAAIAFAPSPREERRPPQVVTTVKLSGHPESFQLEKQGTRIFANVPDAKQIAVIDREKKKAVATWPMDKFQANFPMSLDETMHRLFVGCRKPARLLVLDTQTGKIVADLAISGDTDDLFYDAKRKRIYISCGEGFIDIVERSSADNYQRLAKIATASGARTCFFSPDLDRLYLAVPDRGNQKAEIRVYQPE
jgi:YVTN family beta-propeller protein